MDQFTESMWMRGGLDDEGVVGAEDALEEW